MKKRYAYRLLREKTWQVRLAMLERVKGIEQTPPRTAKDLNIGS